MGLSLKALPNVQELATIARRLTVIMPESSRAKDSLEAHERGEDSQAPVYAMPYTARYMLT